MGSVVNGTNSFKKNNVGQNLNSFGALVLHSSRKFLLIISLALNMPVSTMTS